MYKPIAVTWAILILLGSYGAIHFFRVDRIASILNIVLVVVSGFGLRRELSRPTVDNKR